MTCPGGCVFLGLDHPVRQAGECSLLWELLEAFQHCASHGVFQRNHISTCRLRTDIADLMCRAVNKLHCQQIEPPFLFLSTSSWFIMIYWWPAYLGIPSVWTFAHTRFSGREGTHTRKLCSPVHLEQLVTWWPLLGELAREWCNLFTSSIGSKQYVYNWIYVEVAFCLFWCVYNWKENEWVLQFCN